MRPSIEGAWFDQAAADAAAAFFPRYLCFTEGARMGEAFRLEPWQEQIARDLFGWKRPDGTRVYRTAWIEVARKNGKTELAAGLALLLLVADGEGGAQVYAAAVDKEQAKLVFNKATAMVAMSPELSQHVETFKTALFVPALNGSFKPLSAIARSKHGFSPSGMIGDELHEWQDDELYDVIHKGTGARKQPLEILITTAGQKGVGFGWEMHEKARRILAGEEEDPEFYAVIYAAGEDDDWRDPAIWAKANPNLGVSVSEAYMESECRKAASSARHENNFRRYHLNQWTEQIERWLAMDDWRACSRDPTAAHLWRELMEEARGRPAYGGLDLGSVSDLCALAWYVPPETGERGLLLWRHWLPKAALNKVQRAKRRLFDGWVAAGALDLTPGNVADYDYICEAVMADCEVLQCLGLGIDRWNATQTAVRLKNEGLPVELMGQGYATLAAPTKELERLVMARDELEHGNHPVARWMAGNVTVKIDPAGNIKPDKESAGDKIDGIVAAIMAIGLAMADEPEELQRYEKGSLFL